MAARRKNPDEEILVAKDSGFITIDGRELFFRKDITRAHAGHAIVKANPDLWEPLKIHYGLEQATAAPGEQRGA